MEKREIRKKILAMRTGLSEQEVRDKSRSIEELVFRSSFFRDARTVYCYISCKNEVLTEGLIRRAWKMGKKVAVPRVRDQSMFFYYIHSFSELSPGYMQVMEPAGDGEDPADDESALILMPGVAFDRSFHRCGYGKGFYDRYLAEHPDHIKAALSYEFQIADRIPADPYDICPDYIITEKGIYTR